MRFEGTHELTRLREDEIVRRGIGRKFQTPAVFASLTCFENVEVAAGFRDRMPRALARQRRTQGACDVGARTRRPERPRDVLASALSHGERQWLEIAMLLVQDPKLLLLDEPVAGMTGEERDTTGELLHALEGAHSLIVTEHDMDFVRQFSRMVTVLHMGKVLTEGRVDEIQQDPAVQDVYLGRSRIERRREQHDDRGCGRCCIARPVATGTRSTRGSMLRPSNVSIAYGQSVVVRDVSIEAAVGRGHLRDGSQRRRQDHAAEGDHGRAADQERSRAVRRHDVTRRSPFQRARTGIGYVPQGRGIFPHLSVIENLLDRPRVDRRQGHAASSTRSTRCSRC